MRLNTENQLGLTRSILEMYESLNKAIDQAGGSGIGVDILSKVTALELLTFLVPNGIRFVWVGEKPPDITEAVKHWPRLKDGTIAYPGIRVIGSYAGDREYGPGTAHTIYDNGYAEVHPDAWTHSTRLKLSELSFYSGVPAK